MTAPHLHLHCCSSKDLGQRPSSFCGETPRTRQGPPARGGSCLQRVTEINTQNKNREVPCCGPGSPKSGFCCLGQVASSTRDFRAQDAHGVQKGERNTASASHAQTQRPVQRGQPAWTHGHKQTVTPSDRSSRSSVSRPRCAGAWAHRQGGLRGPPVQ